MDTQAQAIAKEFGGEVLNVRVDATTNEIVVLLVDGRKIRRPRFAEQIAIQPAEAVSTNEEQTAPPVSVPNLHKKGKGK